MKRGYPFSIASDFRRDRYTSKTPLQQYLPAIPTSPTRAQVILSCQPQTERPFAAGWKPNSAYKSTRLLWCLECLYSPQKEQRSGEVKDRPGRSWRG